MDEGGQAFRAFLQQRDYQGGLFKDLYAEFAPTFSAMV
jgi:hypothetical protein